MDILEPIPENELESDNLPAQKVRRLLKKYRKTYFYLSMEKKFKGKKPSFTSPNRLNSILHKIEAIKTGNYVVIEDEQ